MRRLLLKGGRLLDPASGLDRLLDVRIQNGTVKAIGVSLPAAGATVLNVKGLVVVPGLIDVHLHLMNGLGAFGADPDLFGVGSGVTTVVDAGSTGHSLFPVFRRYVAEPARSRVLAYVNLSTLGSVAGPGYAALADPRLIDEEKIAAVVEANRDRIVGIKVMATGTALGAEGLKPLKRARRLADSLQLPLLVHIGESWGRGAEPPPIGKVLAHLRPGDIVTHMFTAHPGGLLDPNGKLWPQVCDARDSRILFDVGHGLHNLNFDVARRVLDQGLQPDGVSTDGHRGNRAGPVYDLPTTMAKLMALGFSLSQVVEMATANAARLLRREKELGAIRVGRPAEITVLRSEEREWEAVDSQQGKLKARQALVPVFTIRNGAVCDPLPSERP
ncbi:MAG: dihydroorotase [Deltaproteobacteria bacterium RIFCSPLOWO2_12_FULL_60_19]|nr:MAG: dihydroorotase [Deltaproteobacteria bacterium RIFCSPLOWO2_12_FULL_60_19]